MDTSKVHFVSEGLLKLAVNRLEESVREGLADHPVASPKRLLLPLHSLPGYDHVELQAAKRVDGSIRCYVQSLGNVPLEEELCVDFPDAPEPPLEVDDGAVEGKNGSRWFPSPGGLQPEVVEVDDAGEAVTRKVNTDKYSVYLTCACGNVRYAMRSSIHQVDRCRVCSKRSRHAYQVEWQRRKRRSE